MLDDHDLIDRAITDAYERVIQLDDEQQGEITAVQRKLTETRVAMDRYFRAFEAGTMPEDTCAPRIAALSEEAKALEARAAELTAHEDEEQPERATPADLDGLRSTLHAALSESTPADAKTALHTLIDQIRVDARDHIEPTFRIPAVRIDYGYMAAVEGLSNQDLQGALVRLSEKLARLRRGNSKPRPAVPQRLRARRPGWVLTAIVQVLADRGEPMRAKDIHTAVEAFMGEPVVWSSIRSALASHASASSRRVVRVARGRYALSDRSVDDGTSPARR